MFQPDVTSLINRYFSHPERTISVAADETLIDQNGRNERLYYVLEGELEGFASAGENTTRVFHACQGAFIGVHSFFSGTWIASSTVIAKTNAKLAWIDRHIPPVEQETFGPLTAQFTPVIVNELSRRQWRATQEALAKEKVLKKLYLAEQMTTLGQLAAGLAHELNNSIGVVSSKSERLEHIVVTLLEALHPEASEFFDHGLLNGQKSSSSDVRIRAKTFEKRYGLDSSTAKDLARAVTGDSVAEQWLRNPQDAVKYWKMGRDLHDLRSAAKHTVGIVRSVKQLGRVDVDAIEDININESINRAVALLQSDLRTVEVRLSPGEIPPFRGSQTELVQVWVNIIKNACDAMNQTAAPVIEIKTRVNRNRLLVTITNNGPEIEPNTRRRLFDPNFTTKKGGLSFGLGLGLSIVRRIISSYGGSIAVKSDSQKTIFRIKLPIED
ncbi:histidine kinase [Vibrio panuliri]|uniref:histidine kinase n=1 Tax=Vibrio panuliri TaxID=1381081 RepID=A0A1Q9HF47_9VIBR|nr:ATP-binding protein [Vibrio panuliri]OLQ88328.1 histidine kinase [Vibrio panuliri]